MIDKATFQINLKPVEFDEEAAPWFDIVELVDGLISQGWELRDTSGVRLAEHEKARVAKVRADDERRSSVHHPGTCTIG